MYLLPAIDLLEGHVVRLAKGDYQKVTVYHDDPSLQAQLFEEAGATWVHVVDLDGAKTGVPTNLCVVERILQRTNLSVEFGGGIRDLETLKRVADTGVQRIILGTALIKNPDFAQEAIDLFGPLLAAGVDARHGEVAIEGWRETGDMTAKGLATQMASLGFEHLIFTDINRDGMQSGIDPQAYVHIAAAFRRPVIASGGVATIADIEALCTISSSVEGVIAGRALYEGTLTVEEAVAVCDGSLREVPMPDESAPFTADDLL